MKTVTAYDICSETTKKKLDEFLAVLSRIKEPAEQSERCPTYDEDGFQQFCCPRRIGMLVELNNLSNRISAEIESSIERWLNKNHDSVPDEDMPLYFYENPRIVDEPTGARQFDGTYTYAGGTYLFPIEGSDKFIEAERRLNCWASLGVNVTANTIGSSDN